MTALIQDDITWEYDFITIEILQNKYKIIKFSPQLMPPQHRNCIIIFNYKFRDAVKYIKITQPKVIFFMSDERGYPTEEYAKHTKVFLHCYNHNFFYTKNSLQLPLGYASGYTGGRSILTIKPKKIKDRKFMAAFVGDRDKHDRPLMLQKMEELSVQRNMAVKFEVSKNSWSMSTQKITPPEIFEIYNDSIFVPIGRGYYSLDCFRIYEAIASGSIPVIVGPLKEINITFKFNGSSLPALFFENWESARVGCDKLLNDLQKLQKIQTQLINWFKKRIIVIRNKINS